ncbi:MAG: N-acetyl sugar amidotransferase [Magnetovibrio sp.]|nr:N-acetyl sugar amidotransferase [Magnetovibrio sp.]
MKYCTKCVLPTTRPGLTFDEAGVCSACRSAEVRVSIDWPARELAFRHVVDNAKRKSTGYDCVIPVSGGKDSTWQVAKCKDYGLNPLCVTWRTPGRTPLGQKNLDNLIYLGVDHIDFQINPKVERKFTYKALTKMGTPGLPMHMAIFNIPLNIACRFNVPLMIWGENTASEYTGEAMHQGFRLDNEWVARYGVTHGTVARDWLDDELTEHDLTPYFGPLSFDREKVLGVFLGYYFSWDAENVYKVAATHGFESAARAKTGLYNYADIDDDFISIHHWFKWHKFGFTRLWDNLSLEIRNGRLTREQAIYLIKDAGDQTPYEDIDKFCDFLDISTSHFFSIAASFRNSTIWRHDEGIWRIDDFLIPDWDWHEG